jgi:hypothetical protein
MKTYGAKALSAEMGFPKATNTSQLDHMLSEALETMNRKVEELLKRVEEQDKTINELRTELVKRNSGGGSGGADGTGAPTSWASLVGGKPNASTAAVVAIMAKERKQVEDKERNIIVSGLDENPDMAADKEAIKQVMTSLGVGAAVKASRRIGQGSNGRPRLVVVELADRPTRDQALNSARQLKVTPPFEKVYVKKDRTLNEMLLENELRKKCAEKNNSLAQSDGPEGRLRYETDENGKKWYWGIRWGELRRIDKATGRILSGPRTQSA